MRASCGLAPVNLKDHTWEELEKSICSDASGCVMIDSGDIRGPEEEEMSFVGMVIHRRMVIGFGDSKSSRMSALGIGPDKDHPAVKKVFRGKDLLIVASGRNTFYGRNCGETLLEEWIGENIPGCGDPLRFMFAFYGALESNIEANTGDYRFIFGGYDDKGPYIQRCSVEDGRLVIETKKRSAHGQTCVATDGNSFYSNDIGSKNLSDALDRAGMVDIPGRIRKYVNSLIEEAEDLGCYNPVGGEIVVETLYPPTKEDLPKGVI